MNTLWKVKAVKGWRRHGHFGTANVLVRGTEIIGKLFPRTILLGLRVEYPGPTWSKHKSIAAWVTSSAQFRAEESVKHQNPGISTNTKACRLQVSHVCGVL